MPGCRRSSWSCFRASLVSRASCCLCVLLLSACGSKRLDAFEPLGADGIGGFASVAGGGGNPGAGNSSAGSAGTATEPPDGGAGGAVGPLVTEPLITFADFGESYMVGDVTSELFPVSGQPFTQAWRATVSKPPSSPLSGQLVMPLNKPVKKGQLLHVSFWLNCETVGDNGDCYTEYLFERGAEPYVQSVTFKAHAGPGWSQKSEYFSVLETYASGEAHMVFRLGYATQVIAIGGLELEAIDPLP
jgi:hypothetical protein